MLLSTSDKLVSFAEFPQELDEYRTKLHELEQKFGTSSSQFSEERKEIEEKFGKGAAE